jgi:hypothetical protein
MHGVEEGGSEMGRDAMRKARGEKVGKFWGRDELDGLEKLEWEFEKAHRRSFETER